MPDPTKPYPTKPCPASRKPLIRGPTNPTYPQPRNTYRRTHPARPIMAGMSDGGTRVLHRSERVPPSGSTIGRKGLEMHGGLPFIGFSTIIYGVVGLAVVASGAVTRFRRHK